MITIGIQGKKGSFSEVAANEFAQNHELTSYEIKYLVTSENVLHAVENNQVTYGIFAMENAQGGVVIESVLALAKYRCHIVTMFHILISQNLLTLPSISLKDITEIHSHQQALRQCRHYLTTHFWGLPLIEEIDTAEAASRLRNGELPKTAAVIANKVCAEIYHLQLLQPDIHDLKNNLTLFLAVEHYDETKN